MIESSGLGTGIGFDIGLITGSIIGVPLVSVTNGISLLFAPIGAAFGILYDLAYILF